MEQLDEIIFEFDAFARRGGSDAAPFSIRIAKPGYDDSRGYYCRVYCPFLRAKPFVIFGVDEAQATELSISFLRQSVSDAGVRIVDKNGNQINIPNIDLGPSDPAPKPVR